MGVRVYDTVSGSTFIFPMLPEHIKFSAGTKFIEYELITHGDVVVPLGEELSSIEFDGILPGAKRKGAPYVSNWKNPREIQEIWSVWRNKGRKLRITIDGTPINHGVYLKSYDMDYSGGMGDYSYSIVFVAAKEIDIKIEPKQQAAEKSEEKQEQDVERQYVKVTADKVNVRKSASTSGKIVFVATRGQIFEYAGKKSGNWFSIITDYGTCWISSRYSKISGVMSDSSLQSKGVKTYTVKQGDTLWTIAQKHLGDGSQYEKIKKASNLTTTKINVGQILRIP